MALAGAGATWVAAVVLDTAGANETTRLGCGGAGADATKGAGALTMLVGAGAGGAGTMGMGGGFRRTLGTLVLALVLAATGGAFLAAIAVVGGGTGGCTGLGIA